MTNTKFQYFFFALENILISAFNFRSNLYRFRAKFPCVPKLALSYLGQCPGNTVRRLAKQYCKCSSDDRPQHYDTKHTRMKNSRGFVRQTERRSLNVIQITRCAYNVLDLRSSKSIKNKFQNTIPQGIVDIQLCLYNFVCLFVLCQLMLY